MYYKYFFISCLISLSFSQNELPKPLLNEQIVKHSGFTLSYNEKYEQASWVAYELTADELIKRVKRSDSFKKIVKSQPDLLCHQTMQNLDMTEGTWHQLLTYLGPKRL